MKPYKKVVAKSPGVVIVEETTDELQIQSPTEVIIKNKISHISAGTELACLAGLEDWFKMPATPGYTAIGEIVEVGAAVSDVKVGDLVYTFGGHIGYFKIDITDRWHGVCVLLPVGINVEEAAFTHMAGIAMTAIRKSSIELGDEIAVIGMGTIGNLAAQLAQLQGAHVVAIDINEQRLELAKKCGLSHTFSSKNIPLKQIIEHATDGKGVSTIIDATGVPQVISAAAECINLYGELILLGSPRASFETNITPFLQHIHLWSHGSITVKGALEFTYPTQQVEYHKHSIERNSKIILDLIHQGKLNIKPLVTHVLPVAQAPQAYEGLTEYPDQYVGVLFDWRA